MQPSLLIMAAGMASRYGSLKQMDQFGPSGETILEYAVYDAIQAGFGKVVFVIRKSIEDTFRAHFDKKFAHKIQVEYVCQELDMLPEQINVTPERAKPWGTGQAVWVAGAKIKEPFAVINGDDFYGRQSFKVVADYLRSVDSQSDNYCLVGFKLDNTLSEHGYVSRGICEIDQNGNMQGLAERTKIGKASNGNGIVYVEDDGREVPLTGNETASMNLMGFTPTIFEHCRRLFTQFLKEQGQELKSEFYIPKVVNTLIQEGKAQMKVLSTSEKWFGVTYPADKPIVIEQLANLTKEGVYPKNLWA
jgi:UTP-glucose-1-phosphate uridylyltransferase